MRFVCCELCSERHFNGSPSLYVHATSSASSFDDLHVLRIEVLPFWQIAASTVTWAYCTGQTAAVLSSYADRRAAHSHTAISCTPQSAICQNA